MHGDVATAMVLRVQPLGDADLVVGLLTAQDGRLDVLARGARSSRKRFAGVLRPFCEIDAVVQRPRIGTLPLLVSASLRRDVLGDQVSYPQLCLASYLVELAQHCAQPGQRDAGLSQWLVARLLACRQETGTSLGPLKLSADAGLLSVLGLLPDLHHCAQCGGDLLLGAHWPADGEGLGCRRCAMGAQAWVSHPSLLALHQALEDGGRDAALAIPATDQRLLHDRLGRKVQLAVGQLRSERALRELL